MKTASIAWNEISNYQLLPKPYLNMLTFSEYWKIGDICDIASGMYVPEYCSPNTAGAKYYLRVDNVRQFLPNLSQADLAYVDSRLLSNTDRVTVHSGDIILARTGTLGKAFVVDRLTDGSIMSQHLTRLRILPKYKEVLNPFIVAGYLNSPLCVNRLLSLATGSTRLELTHESMSNIEVPKALQKLTGLSHQIDKIPELFIRQQEQAKEAINECNSLIDHHVKHQRNELECFVISGMPDNLRSLLPRYHLPRLKKVEEELIDNYECKRLRDIADVVRGAGTLSREYSDHGIPFLMTSSIVNYGIELFPEHYATEQVYIMHGQHVGEGDILMTIEGKIGEVALLGKNEKCVVKNHIEIVRLKEKIEVPREFVYSFMASDLGRAQFERRTIVQTTIPGLASGSREILIPLVPKNNRQKRAFKETVEKVADNVKKSVDARVQLRAILEAIIISINNMLCDDI